MVKGEKKPDFFKGPTAAILLSDPDEISNVSKLLVDFSKSNPSLRIKGGFMSKDIISTDVIKQISKVGSKKDLMAKVAGSLYASLSNMRSVAEAPIRDLVYVLNALKDQKN
jgi:large subunit ribosomal protein L10